MAQIQVGLDIDGEAAGDLSGWLISMPDAYTVAIGAHRNDGNGTESGHVRVYKWNGNSWIQKGGDIDGEAAYDWSGRSVSMPDSNTVAIGAPANDGNGSSPSRLCGLSAPRYIIGKSDHFCGENRPFFDKKWQN